jgi:hypothetical protein
MAADTAIARQGPLTCLATKGGALPIRALQAHSLVCYQAGHQAFSQLMEGLVADGRVEYDDATAVFPLTNQGRAAIPVLPARARAVRALRALRVRGHEGCGST